MFRHMCTEAKRLRVVVFAIMLGVSLLFTGGTPALAINGGSSTSVPSYMARISYHVGLTTHGCDGTLIGSRWIATAAHCVINDNSGDKLSPGAFKVAVGVDQPNWGSHWLTVNRVERHPNFPAHLGPQQAWPADVALLQLSTAVSNATLPLAASEPAAGSTVKFAGWGCTGSGSGDCGRPSSSLMVATSTVKTDQQCAFTGAYIAFDICTSRTGPHSTVRHGDSGGPMIKQAPLGARLAGVISGSDDYKDYTSSVPYVLGWIHDVTGIGAPAESNPAPPPTTNSPPANPGPTSYTYTVYHTGGIGLKVRPSPDTSGAPLRVIPEGAQVAISCQVHGQRVLAETDIWDAVVGGGWIYDEYVSTPVIGGFSIRQC